MTEKELETRLEDKIHDETSILRKIEDGITDDLDLYREPIEKIDLGSQAVCFIYETIFDKKVYTMALTSTVVNTPLTTTDKIESKKPMTYVPNVIVLVNPDTYKLVAKVVFDHDATIHVYRAIYSTFREKVKFMCNVYLIDSLSVNKHNEIMTTGSAYRNIAEKIIDEWNKENPDLVCDSKTTMCIYVHTANNYRKLHELKEIYKKEYLSDYVPRKVSKDDLVNYMNTNSLFMELVMFLMCK